MASLPLSPLLSMDGALRGKLVNMVYLVVTIIKLSHETLYTTVNDRSGERMMLYISKIGNDFIKIPYLSFGALPR